MFPFRPITVSVIGLLAFAAVCIPAGAQTTLTIGNVQGLAGSRVTVPVTVENGGVNPRVIVYFVDFDGSALTFVEGAAGDAVAPPPEGVVTVIAGENVVLIAIFALSVDPDLVLVEDGTLVTLTFDISADARGSIALAGRDTSSAADAGAESIGLTLVPGSIGVVCGDVLAPAGVEASENDPDGVLVTWDAVAGAAEYRVYRNTRNESASSTVVSDWIAETEFLDGTAQGFVVAGSGCAPDTAGSTYFYWVVARSAGGCEGPFSTPDTGSILNLGDVAGASNWPRTVPDVLMAALCVCALWVGALLRRMRRSSWV